MLNRLQSAAVPYPINKLTDRHIKDVLVSKTFQVPPKKGNLVVLSDRESIPGGLLEEL